MIPLKDRNSSRRFPIVTIILIMTNIIIYLYQISIGPQAEDFILRFSIIPKNIYLLFQTGVFDSLSVRTLFTSMFMHGGWLHLAGNMLYLWVFGDNVEDKLGRVRFIFFYLTCGITASLMHVFIAPGSTIPMLGASGAISGVLGAYLLMFPKARVLTLIPIFVFIQITELPAYILLGFWFVLQFLNGILITRYDLVNSGGVAWWAHIGGFITGLLLIVPLRKYR